MAPAANSQNTSNTLHTPFPRIPTTSHPLSSSSAANANRRPATVAPNSAPNPRSQAPRSRNMTSSMGPPPAAGAGRRNERFDRLFYTSPLPRSISREYDNLRASQGSAVGGAASTTPTAAVASTAVATMGMTTISKNTATHTISVPSALRRSTSSSGTTFTTNRAEPGTVKPSPFRSSPRNAALSRSNGAPPSKVAVTTDSDDPLSAPNASSIALPSPSRATRSTKPSPGAHKTTKLPVPTKTFTVEIAEYVPMRVDSNSDGEAQDVDGDNKKTTEEEQTRPTSSPRTERAHSPFRVSIPPKKIAKTETAASPGGVRVIRSMRKPTQTPPASTKAAPEDEIAPRQSSLRHNRHASDTTLAAVPVTAPQPPAPVAKPPLSTKALKRILPGFHVPPGILGETGSLWDGGRRVSRRISLPPGSIAPIPPSPRVQRIARGKRKSLDVGEAKVEKRARKSSSDNGHEKSPSTAVESTSEQHGEPCEGKSEDSPGVEQRRDLSPGEHVEEQQKNTLPPLQPQPQQVSVVVRKLRKSLGGKAKRYSTGANNTESESDMLVPGQIGGKIKRRSTLGASVFSSTAFIKSRENTSREAKGPQKDEGKEAQITEPEHGQEAQERGAPQSWRLRTKRSLRSGGDGGRMDRVLSAGIEDSTPVPTKKAAAKRTPAQKKGEDWVVEETPSQAPTSSTATVEIDKGTARKGMKGDTVVDKTPTQAVKRVTRGSVSAGKKSTRGGVGLNGPNAEFEFSDDE